MRIKSFVASWTEALPWGLLLVFVMLSVWLVYRGLDQAVTLDHQEQQYLLFQKQRDVLQSIAEPFMKGITKTQLVNLLQQNNVEYFVNEYANTMDVIVAQQVVFYFDKDKLVRIETN